MLSSFSRSLRSGFIPAFLLAASCFPSAGFAAEPAPVDLPAINAEAATALARADLADYRGWIKFLQREAETAAVRHGATSPAAVEKAARLADWLKRITANSGVIATLTGVQEWAYESPADGSGQPFKIAIPTDYQPAHPAALSVYMHGYSGNHLEHSTGMVSRAGVFDVAVLGRSRAGGYYALSEADVLHVIDYIQAHWAIDPNRIHINGGSMGGAGTYRLGSRYPHRWASGRPTCGYASMLPIANLLTLPLYATHSADDPTVSVLHARGPLARLRALGGQAILDETNGLGHAAWDYAEGNARGAAWVEQQVRPDSRAVRHLDYTATDGAAMRGWWGEIVEWGDAPSPARFVLTAGAGNTLYAGLTNITRLRVRMTESPFDPAKPFSVSVNGGAPITVPAPVPDSVVVVRGETGWSFETAAPVLPFRLHTPGSAALLYQGEPLLIVYGTRGTGAEQAAMRSAAEAAGKSPNPLWLDDSGELGSDGVPHPQNLYGHLNIKSDHAVTDRDIARCHLVLIGTAAQNSLVERLASRLPVRLADGAITCSDGVNFPGGDYALGLVHYNPLAPDRLIFWVASEQLEAYRPGSVVPRLMEGGTFLAKTPSAIDLVVADATKSTLVAARSFDSRWNWQQNRATSQVLPDSLGSQSQFWTAIGAVMRQSAAADFALINRPDHPDAPAVLAGTTRVSDVAAQFYFSPMGTFDLSGAELVSFAAKLSAAKSPLLLQGANGLDVAQAAPDRTYRIVLSIDLLQALARLQIAPATYRHTDLLIGDAIERYLAHD